jgi:succinate-semialdehyde dehydrogenase/glutarate-semialdehyde dehydrogenase
MTKAIDRVREWGLFIAGQWVPASSRKSFPVTDPATGETIATCADGSAADTTAAIDAAHQAFQSWKHTTAYDRAAILRRVADLLLERVEPLGRLLTREMGKPLAEAKGEIAYSASFFTWFAEEAKRVYGETIPSQFAHKRLVAIRQPVGVVAAITPWNFPSAMLARKVAPALAAGCTVVAKPAKQTPLSSLALGELMVEAGVPPGVVNLVTTNRSSSFGDIVLDDVRVSKITFTGSTEVGKALAERGARTVKRMSLELGGLAPFIVFDDADLEAAAAGTQASKFRNMGQTCICANRIYVHESVVDAFAEAFAARVKAMKVGPGLEEGVTLGPLIDQAGFNKAYEHIEDAVKKGAKVRAGGKRLSGGEFDRGYFLEPTVLTGVTDEMLCAVEETFGPVAPIFSFKDEAEVITRANNTRFGLAGYVYTRDLSRAWRVAEALEYGIIGVNDPVPSTAQAPFGGLKESGLMREGGWQGLDAFLETKFISIGI